MLKRIFNFTIFIFLIFSLNSIFAAKKKSKKKAEKVSMFYTEVSIEGSASKYSNSKDTETYVTSWGGSIGFTFAGTETIELEYKNAYQKSETNNILIRSFYDTYGVNYLHALSSGRIRPYLKVGIGYVKSKYTISSDEHPEVNKSEKRPPTISYTGGIGLKIYITRSISFRASYTAQYIDADESANGDSNTEFNYFLSGGLSYIF